MQYWIAKCDSCGELRSAMSTTYGMASGHFNNVYGTCRCGCAEGIEEEDLNYGGAVYIETEVTPVECDNRLCQRRAEWMVTHIGELGASYHCGLHKPLWGYQGIGAHRIRTSPIGTVLVEEES